MGRGNVKEHLKKKLKNLFKSLDFVSDNFLNIRKILKRELEIYYNI